MEDTFPKLLLRNYQQWGDSRLALRKKQYGIWREYTWKDCYQKVKAIFLGLVTIGLEAGDKASILGDSNPEWLWSELAVQAAGGRRNCLPITLSASSKELTLPGNPYLHPGNALCGAFP